jgi:hypothetical protein
MPGAPSSVTRIAGSPPTQIPPRVESGDDSSDSEEEDSDHDADELERRRKWQRCRSQNASRSQRWWVGVGAPVLPTAAALSGSDEGSNSEAGRVVGGASGGDGGDNAITEISEALYSRPRSPRNAVPSSPTTETPLARRVRSLMVVTVDAAQEQAVAVYCSQPPSSGPTAAATLGLGAAGRTFLIEPPPRGGGARCTHAGRCTLVVHARGAGERGSAKLLPVLQRLAFVQGLHSRTGSLSPVACLSFDLARLVHEWARCAATERPVPLCSSLVPELLDDRAQPPLVFMSRPWDPNQSVAPCRAGLCQSSRWCGVSAARRGCAVKRRGCALARAPVSRRARRCSGTRSVSWAGRAI